MHFFDYQNAPVKLLTPEITALLSAIHEFKGKQELYPGAIKGAWTCQYSDLRLWPPNCERINCSRFKAPT